MLNLIVKEPAPGVVVCCISRVGDSREAERVREKWRKRLMRSNKKETSDWIHAKARKGEGICCHRLPLRVGHPGA